MQILESKRDEVRPAQWAGWRWRAAIMALALNAAVAASPCKGYDVIKFRGLQFPALIPFKPLMLLNAVVLLACLFAGRDSEHRNRAATDAEVRSGKRAFMFVAALAIVVYLPSLPINFWHHDWTHRHIGQAINSWQAVRGLFYRPQVDGMYRPLGLLSFVLDYRWFGPGLWGYHLQSIAVHAVNSLLVLALGRRLGLRWAASWTAAAFFAVAAIHCEAVVWPAARFDLLACMFSLISVILFIDYCRTAGAKRIAAGCLSLLAFVLAVMSKETGYGLLLIVPALLYWRRVWEMPALSPPQAGAYLAGLFTLGGICGGIRFAVFHGPGGFGYGTGGSAVGHISLKSAWELLANVAGLTPFAIKAPTPSAIVFLIVGIYLGIAVALVWSCGLPRTDGVEWRLGLLALLSALPALAVIGWIRPSLEHTRHLYLPSVWIALLIGAVLTRPSVRPMLTWLLLAVQSAALLWNMQVYRDVLTRARIIAVAAHDEIRMTQPAAVEIQLNAVPEELDGVGYFDAELQHQLQAIVPAPVHLCDAESPCGQLRKGGVLLKWDASKSRLDVSSP